MAVAVSDSCTFLYRVFFLVKILAFCGVHTCIFISVEDSGSTGPSDATAMKFKVRLKEQVSADCVNGISLHPYAPYLSVTSGQRRLVQSMADDSEDSSGSESTSAPVGQNSLDLFKVISRTPVSD